MALLSHEPQRCSSVLAWWMRVHNARGTRREKLKAPTPKVALAPARRSAVRSASMSSLLLAWLNDASNPDAFPDPIPDPIPNPNPKPNP